MEGEKWWGPDVWFLLWSVDYARFFIVYEECCSGLKSLVILIDNVCVCVFVKMARMIPCRASSEKGHNWRNWCYIVHCDKLI